MKVKEINRLNPLCYNGFKGSGGDWHTSACTKRQIGVAEVVMVRIADGKDAEQLGVLNDEFNGKGETTVENIRNSIGNNPQEVVIVADENGVLVGFVCVQLKRSFCYDDYMPEITEVYVVPAHRRKGIASEMITFAEAYCARNYSFRKYELLTGKKNVAAQSVYGRLGYADDEELHLSKRIRR